MTCLAALFVTGQVLGQEPVFSAAVSTDKVAQNSVFEIQFELKNATGGSFKPPTFENFKVVGGPSTSSSTMIMNGQVSRSESWSYSLLAVSVGKFTIGPATVAAGRKVLSSRPLTIEVVKSKSPSESGVTSSGKEKVILIANLDSSTYYPGQQIILRYKLLFNENIQSISALSEDDYSDFFIQNFNSFDRQATMENVNGVPFTSKIIKAVALFAHQSGDYVIDPMILDVGVEAPFPERHGFFTMRNLETMKVASAPKTVHIKPLPAGAPSSFSGAVGQYTMSSRPGTTDITTDNAFTLQVDIKGDGDSKRWDPPKAVVDGDFEIYDPRITEDKVVDEQDHIAHYRTIEYQMIPRQSGHFKIVIPFSYFNPITRKYESANSDTMNLNVTQGNNKPTYATSTEKPDSPRPLRKVRNITTDDRFWLSIPHLFLFGFIVSGACWGAWFSYRRKREEAIPQVEKIRSAASKKAQVQLDNLVTSSASIEGKEFFERATEIYYRFLSEKLTIPSADLDQDKLPVYLGKRNVTTDVQQRVIHLFEQCLSVRYGGIPGGYSREEMVDVIKNTIRSLES
jgi:hypothetical protein